jgi:GNAT superfamily N-acetyltransferase
MGGIIEYTQLYPKYSSARLAKNWILNDLFVDIPFRKQGIGQQLIKTAMLFAEKQNAKFMDIYTAVDNFFAQALYEKIGFERQMHDLTFYDYRIKLDSDESAAT